MEWDGGGGHYVMYASEAEADDSRGVEIRGAGVVMLPSHYASSLSATMHSLVCRRWR